MINNNLSQTEGGLKEAKYKCRILQSNMVLYYNEVCLRHVWLRMHSEGGGVLSGEHTYIASGPSSHTAFKYTRLQLKTTYTLLNIYLHECNSDSK